MLKLTSSAVELLSDVTEKGTILRRISEASTFISAFRKTDYCLVRSGENIPDGFAGYLFLEKPDAKVPKNSFLLDPAFNYIRSGDIIKLNAIRRIVRVVYRKNSAHNSFLLTEQCNNFCLMCSQPPKDIDDSYIAEEVLQIVPLMALETKAVGLTGGEPTLLGDKLLQIIQAIKGRLPQAALHILSNGRNFKDYSFAKAVADIRHPDLMIGIPVYSDIASMHDYVVQADGAYDDTIRGIVNLKSLGVKVEIRVVLHKATYERLAELALFIRRNLTFVDQVVFMGLEMMGFTKINLDKLWVDPVTYQPQLKAAVTILDQARMNVSIYNSQLCLLDPSLKRFSRKSISDWKNEYMPECVPCIKKDDCAGFFSSANLRYSDNISPFLVTA